MYYVYTVMRLSIQDKPRTVRLCNTPTHTARGRRSRDHCSAVSRVKKTTKNVMEDEVYDTCMDMYVHVCCFNTYSPVCCIPSFVYRKKVLADIVHVHVYTCMTHHFTKVVCGTNREWALVKGPSLSVCGST